MRTSICLLGLLLVLAGACDRGQSAAERGSVVPSGAHAVPDEGPASGDEAETPVPAEPTVPAAATEAELAELAAGLSWTDPRAMALEVLDRCKGTNPRALLAVATRANQHHEVVVREGQTVCAAIFGAESWRNRAVTAWDGRLRAVRMRGDQARAMFHEMADDEVAVVSMTREDGTWRFDDINSPDRASFESWGDPVE